MLSLCHHYTIWNWLAILQLIIHVILNTSILQIVFPRDMETCKIGCVQDQESTSHRNCSNRSWWVRRADKTSFVWTSFVMEKSHFPFPLVLVHPFELSQHLKIACSFDKCTLGHIINQQHTTFNLGSQKSAVIDIFLQKHRSTEKLVVFV